jgi:hypothetical protein
MQGTPKEKNKKTLPANMGCSICLAWNRKAEDISGENTTKVYLSMVPMRVCGKG